MNSLKKNSLKHSFDLIGACLAPVDESRLPLLKEKAGKIESWEEVLRLSWDRNVTPLIYGALRKADLDYLLPERLREQFKRIYLNVATHNSLRIRQVLPVLSELQEEGVPVLIFKGLSLALAEDFPDLGHRMFSDIDVIAHDRHEQEIRRAFNKHGYCYELNRSSPTPRVETKWLNKWGTLVEVHWTLFPLNGVPDKVPLERLWSHAIELQCPEGKVILPSPEDRFVQSAIHSTAHHTFDSSHLFMSLSDLAYLAGNGAAPLDWDRIEKDLLKEKMLEHVMVAIDLGVKMTGYGPLQKAKQELNQRNRDIEAKVEPFSRSLYNMVQKPWSFSSDREMRIFAKEISRGRKLRQFVPAYVRRFVLRSVYKKKNIQQMLPGEYEIDKLNVTTKGKRKVLDPDYLKHVWELYRFYRKINYLGIGWKC